MTGPAGRVGINIPSGGGLIFNRDSTFEPVRKTVVDVHWDWQKEKLCVAYMNPPPKVILSSYCGVTEPREKEC